MKISEFLAMDEKEKSEFVAKNIFGWSEEIVTNDYAEYVEDGSIMWLGSEETNIPRFIKSGSVEHSGTVWEIFKYYTPDSMMQIISKMDDLFSIIGTTPAGKEYRYGFSVDITFHQFYRLWKTTFYGDGIKDNIDEDEGGGATSGWIKNLYLSVAIAAGLALGVLVEG